MYCFWVCSLCCVVCGWLLFGYVAVFVAVAVGIVVFSTTLLAVRFHLLVLVLLVLMVCFDCFRYGFALVWLCSCDLRCLWLDFDRLGVGYGG